MCIVYENYTHEGCGITPARPQEAGPSSLFNCSPGRLANQMNQDEIKSLFDQQAAGYDAQWAKTQPVRDCLHLILESALAELPSEANILCVGVGTGAELAHLARKWPEWRFTAVDPSGGILASSDLSSDVESPEYEVLLRAWMNMMSASGVPPEGMERMRKAYANDVGVLPPGEVSSIILAGGFESAVQFFQAGLIHGWISKRAGLDAA